MFNTILLADEATWYPISFDSPLNIARAVAFWLTIALAIAFIVGVAVLTALKNDKRKKFLKVSLITAVAYACAVGITLLCMTFAEDGIKPILFYPLLVLVVLIAVSAVALYFNRSLATKIATGCLTGGALIATLVCSGVHFASGEAAEDNWLTNDQVNTIGLYVSVALLIAVIIVLAFVFGRKDKKGFDTKAIAYAAICIAMSFALSYLRIVKMPQGGSITIASLLPLMIYSYMFGTKKGVFAGMIYGMLQAIQDPYILHPAQFLLDYPVAFAAIGLSGMFAKVSALDKYPQLQFALGAVVGGVGRFIVHFFSGIFAFGAFSGSSEMSEIVLYSLGYQAAYVLPDIAIVVVVGVFVFSSKNFVKQVRKFNTTAEEKKEQLAAAQESNPQA